MVPKEEAPKSLFYTDIFPLICDKCNMRFSTETDLLIAISRQHDFFSLDEMIAWIRKSQSNNISLKCKCGNTLFVPFKERRVTEWPKGLKRRLFGEKLKALMKQGMSKEEARQHLLKKLQKNKNK